MMRSRTIRGMLAAGLIVSAAACELTSETWSGRPTAPGKMLFDYVDDHVCEALRAARTAVTFEEYYRQTSEAARGEMRERYFHACRLALDGTTWLVIHQETVVWSIEMKEGLGLGEPGAEWRIYALTGSKAVVKPDGEGGLLCSMEPVGKMSGKSGWRITSGFDSRKYTISVEGSGQMEWRERAPTLRVGYTVREPIVYDSEAGGVIAGRVTIESSASGKENESVEASYGGDDKVWIGYRSFEEWWNRGDRRYYEDSDYESYDF